MWLCWGQLSCLSAPLGMPGLAWLPKEPLGPFLFGAAKDQEM